MVKKKKAVDVDEEVLEGYETSVEKHVETIKELTTVELKQGMNPVTTFFSPNEVKQEDGKESPTEIKIGKSAEIERKTAELQKLQEEKKVIPKGIQVVTH